MMKTTIIKNIGCGLLLLGTTACADKLDKESIDNITPEQKKKQKQVSCFLSFTKLLFHFLRIAPFFPKRSSFR